MISDTDVSPNTENNTASAVRKSQPLHSSKTRASKTRASTTRSPAIPSLAMFFQGFKNLNSFSEFAHYLLLVYCFFAPLSIAVAQTALILLSVQWLFLNYHSPRARRILYLIWNSKSSSGPRILLRSMLAFQLICIFSAGIGIDPASSLFNLLKSSIYLIVPLAITTALFPTFGTSPRGTVDSSETQPEFFLRLRIYLFSLACGFSIAALASVVYVASEGRVSFGLPGPVTQSGQLALAIPCLIMLSLLVKEEELQLGMENRKTLLRGLLVTVAVLALAWSWKWHAIGGLLALLLVGALLILLYREKPKTESRTTRIVLAPRSLAWVGGIYLATLVINLKRGPWLAVVTELVILGLLFSRRLAILTVACVLSVFIFLQPARDRLAHSFADFSVSGGRKTMWELGVELSQRFPLGLGPHNARFMQHLDPTLPELHRHMHNNLLNVAVETGWIGLGIFIWWMFVTIRLGFLLWRHCENNPSAIARRASHLGLLASIALLGWQVAGVVEYNYGDSEVRMLALTVMGILVATSVFCSKQKGVGSLLATPTNP